MIQNLGAVAVVIGSPFEDSLNAWEKQGCTHDKNDLANELSRILAIRGRREDKTEKYGDVKDIYDD